MTAERDSNGSWPDMVPGPLGTPPPEFAHRRESGPLEPATMPSGDRVPVAVRYEDVRALLVSPTCSRNLRLPGLPRLVSGIGIDYVGHLPHVTSAHDGEACRWLS